MNQEKYLLDSSFGPEIVYSGKKYINLGLGINPGVTFFKTKWGGVPFLPHISYIHEPTRTEIWADIFDSLR